MSDTFRDYCPSCQQISEIREIRVKRGSESVGEADDAVWECQECEYTFKV